MSSERDVSSEAAGSAATSEAAPERREPTFRSLLASNLRVVGIAILVGAAAYGGWRALRALFPDVAWLQ